MLIKWLHNSGAPKMFLWLAKNMAAKGHDITVMTYMDVERPLTVPEGVKHLHMSLQDKSVIKKVYAIRNVIIKLNPDVSISFLLDANVFNVLACLKLRSQSIVCERNDPFKPKYYKLKFFKPLLGLANGAVFQLQKVAEYYNNIRGTTAIIPNPVFGKTDINVGTFEKREDTISCVGRLDIFQKRQDVLIKAFGRFHRTFPNYKLLIYGGGPDEEKLKQLTRNVGVDKFVIFKGVISSPQEAIKRTKFFVLSSDFEGIPNSLVEAMTIGLPCISTDCRPGGAALLIDNKKNGLLVQPGDVEGMEQAMIYMASRPAEAQRMGDMAKEIKIRFSEEKIADMWDEFVRRFQ